MRVDIETSKIDFTLVAERIRSRAEVAAMEAPEYKPGAAPVSPKVAPLLKPAKPVEERYKAAPRAAAQRSEPVAKAVPQKVVMTVSSANPPTTPLEGLDVAKASSRYGKAVVTPKVGQNRGAGALLSNPAGTQRNPDGAAGKFKPTSKLSSGSASSSASGSRSARTPKNKKS